jgi:hypothetical protein
MTPVTKTTANDYNNDADNDNVGDNSEGDDNNAGDRNTVDSNASDYNNTEDDDNNATLTMTTKITTEIVAIKSIVISTANSIRSLIIWVKLLFVVIFILIIIVVMRACIDICNCIRSQRKIRHHSGELIILIFYKESILYLGYATMPIKEHDGFLVRGVEMDNVHL